MPETSDEIIARQRAQLPKGHRRSVPRPGSGPALVSFSRAELRALVTFSVWWYIPESATTEERAAIGSALAKLKKKSTTAKGMR